MAKVNNLPPIVISGSIAIDRIMNFGGQFPDIIKADKLHSLSISILLDSLRDTPGGVGANIAYSMALLGDKPVLLGSIGENGREYIMSLNKLGIDTSHVHESQLPTASFNVITDGGNRQFGGFYPGAMADSDGLTLETWKDQQPLIVISPHDPAAMRRQVAECQKYSLRLFYDVGQQATNIGGEDITAGVAASELLISNDYEFAVICHKIGKKPEEVKAQVPVVVTTFGGEGAVIEGKKVPKAIKITAAKPKEVVDPTGAGDGFRAGFLYGYIRGWELKTCGQLGAICGTYAVEHLGTQGHSFTFNEVGQRYKQTYNQTLPI